MSENSTSLNSVIDSRLRRLLGFAVVGVSGIFVDVGFVTAATVLGGHYLLANAVGYGIAVTWNFALNYRLVWGSPDGSVREMYVQYLGADIGLFAVRIGIVVALVEWIGVPEAPVPGLGTSVSGEVLASLLGILAVAAATFWIAETRVFEQDDSNDK